MHYLLIICTLIFAAGTVFFGYLLSIGAMGITLFFWTAIIGFIASITLLTMEAR